MSKQGMKMNILCLDIIDYLFNTIYMQLMKLLIFAIVLIVSFNVTAQKVLNGDLENYIPYNYTCNSGMQDSVFFNAYIPDVSITYRCTQPFQNSHIKKITSNDTCLNNFGLQYVMLGFTDSVKNGNAHLHFSMIAMVPSQPCPGNYVAKVTNPTYHFRLSSNLYMNKIYILRVDIARYMTTSPLNDTIFIGASVNDFDNIRSLTKVIDNRPIQGYDPYKWGTFLRVFIPDTAYNFLSVRKSDYHNCDCNINSTLDHHMITTSIFLDNLILDTCVQVGTKHTVSVSPCQNAFPLTLQSPRTGGSKYFWSNNDTLQATVVNDTGVYLSFVYDSIGCAVIDSFNVQYDTTLTEGNSSEAWACPNTETRLEADTGAQWYQWNTGSVAQSIQVTDTGLYWVKTKQGNCYRTDSFFVKKYTVVPLLTAEERSICGLQVATLQVTHPHYHRYLWSTGDTTSEITVTQSGKYYITARDSVCSITDSVQVLIINQLPERVDTGICYQSSITLQARPADSYIWSTGASTSQLNVNQTGTYTVTRAIQQCQLTDTFTVTNYQTPTTNESDTMICTGTAMVLKAEASSRYQWNTGDTTQLVQIRNAGKYVVVKTIPPCQGTEIFNVGTHPLPQILTVGDTTVCFDEVKQILLDAGQFKQYLWKPTGETTRTIYSNTAQVYKLTVTDSNTCVSSKDFEVMEECPYSLYVPNAFTPNGDDVNDVLVIKGNRIDAFRMMVVNRWGQVEFETNRMDDYWTGANSTNDVYTLIIEYSALGKTKLYKGTVTLMR
jgi:hypothetical protein